MRNEQFWKKYSNNALWQKVREFVENHELTCGLSDATQDEYMADLIGLIEQMKEDGHVVGNHTFHHVQLSTVGEEIFLRELQETNRVLEGILEEEIVYVRPPFGDWEKSLEQEIDMLPVLWDIDPLDWCTGNAGQIVKKVIDDVEDHSIILLHDEYAASVEATFEIIDRLRNKGYEFVTVDQILLK